MSISTGAIERHTVSLLKTAESAATTRSDGSIQKRRSIYGPELLRPLAQCQLRFSPLPGVAHKRSVALTCAGLPSRPIRSPA